MKHNPLRFVIMIAALLLSLFGSGFTYQGRLHESGDPAQANYDMYFTLYDAAVKGTAVSKTLELRDVPAMNGYFTVELDFETAGVTFNGLPRWLQVAVKPAGIKMLPQILSPRQAISPVPYAIKTETAERLAPPALITNSIVRMEIDGQTTGYFHSFNQLGQSVDVITYQDGDDSVLRKRPGRTTVPNVEFKCFASDDAFIENWYNGVKSGAVTREIVTITLLDQSGNPVDRWRLYHCWPRLVRYDYDRRFETVIMTFQLAVEQAVRMEILPSEIPDPWQPGPQPQVKSPFKLEIGGIERLEFASFNGLGGETEVIEYQDGEDLTLRKRPGRTTYYEPVFTRPVQQDTYLKNWYQTVLDMQVVRYSPTLKFNDASGRMLMQGAMMHCWPCRVHTVYDYALKETCEAVTFAYEEFITTF